MKFSMLGRLSFCRLTNAGCPYFIHPPSPAPRSMTVFPLPSTTLSPSIRRMPFDMVRSCGVVNEDNLWLLEVRRVVENGTTWCIKLTEAALK